MAIAVFQAQSGILITDITHRRFNNVDYSLVNLGLARENSSITGRYSNKLGAFQAYHYNNFSVLNTLTGLYETDNVVFNHLVSGQPFIYIHYADPSVIGNITRAFGINPIYPNNSGYMDNNIINLPGIGSGIPTYFSIDTIKNSLSVVANPYSFSSYPTGNFYENKNINSLIRQYANYFKTFFNIPVISSGNSLAKPNGLQVDGNSINKSLRYPFQYLGFGQFFVNNASAPFYTDHILFTTIYANLGLHTMIPGTILNDNLKLQNIYRKPDDFLALTNWYSGFPISGGDLTYDAVAQIRRPQYLLQTFHSNALIQRYEIQGSNFTFRIPSGQCPASVLYIGTTQSGVNLELSYQNDSQSFTQNLEILDEFNTPSTGIIQWNPYVYLQLYNESGNFLSTPAGHPVWYMYAACPCNINESINKLTVDKPYVARDVRSENHLLALNSTTLNDFFGNNLLSIQQTWVPTLSSGIRLDNPNNFYNFQPTLIPNFNHNLVINDININTTSAYYENIHASGDISQYEFLIPEAYNFLLQETGSALVAGGTVETYSNTWSGIPGYRYTVNIFDWNSGGGTLQFNIKNSKNQTVGAVFFQPDTYSYPYNGSIVNVPMSASLFLNDVDYSKWRGLNATVSIPDIPNTPPPLVPPFPWPGGPLAVNASAIFEVTVYRRDEIGNILESEIGYLNISFSGNDADNNINVSISLTASLAGAWW